MTLKTIEILSRPKNYEKLNKIGFNLQQLQTDTLNRSGIKHKIIGVETLFEVLWMQIYF